MRQPALDIPDPATGGNRKGGTRDSMGGRRIGNGSYSDYSDLGWNNRTVGQESASTIHSLTGPNRRLDREDDTPT